MAKFGSHLFDYKSTHGTWLRGIFPNILFGLLEAVIREQLPNPSLSTQSPKS